jgi:hypothetical protein
MPSWAFSFLLQDVVSRPDLEEREYIPELFARGDTAFPGARRVAARIHPSRKGNLTKRNTSEHCAYMSWGVRSVPMWGLSY